MAAKVIDFGYGYQPFHVAFYEATNGDDYQLRRAMPDITFIETSAH